MPEDSDAMHPTLDPSLCLKDGLCGRTCPMGRLARDGEGRPITDSPLRCIGCGHCAAVCPSGALTFQDGALEPLPADWRLDAARVARLMKGRRSIRAFRGEPLPRETIAELIGIAQYAPSGHNAQPLSWTVVGDRPAVRRIAEATISWMRQSLGAGSPLAAALDMQALVDQWDAGRDPICRSAPHLVIAHAPASFPSGAHSAAIALTFLDLAAQPLGVGTCWAGFVLIGAGASPDLHAALALPEGQRCAGVVMVGRPAVMYRRIPRRNAPRIDWR